MTKKEIVEGFNTYLKMNESAKEKALDDKDLNRRTMWGIIFFLVMYSIATTAALFLKIVEYFSH